MFYIEEFFFWINFYEAVMFIFGQHCKWWLCSLIHLENFYFMKESGLQWMNDSLSCLGGFPVGLLRLLGWCRGRCTWRSPHGQMGTYLNAHLWLYFSVTMWRRRRKEELGCLSTELIQAPSCYDLPWAFLREKKTGRGVVKILLWELLEG